MVCLYWMCLYVMCLRAVQLEISAWTSSQQVSLQKKEEISVLSDLVSLLLLRSEAHVLTFEPTDSRPASALEEVGGSVQTNVTQTQEVALPWGASFLNRLWLGLLITVRYDCMMSAAALTGANVKKKWLLFCCILSNNHLSPVESSNLKEVQRWITGVPLQRHDVFVS